MLRYLKLKNHKAIKEIRLENLGQINVFCGRNNSGKTAILEAIYSKDKHSLGYRISDFDRPTMTERFGNVTRGYSHRQRFDAWFEGAREHLVGRLFYQDEIEELSRQLNGDVKKSTGFGNEFQFSELFFNKFIEGEAQKIEPFLITPKRELKAKVSAGHQEGMKYLPPEKIVRRLFHLSTQGRKTAECEVFEKIKKAFLEITDGYDFWLNTTEDGFVSLSFLNAKGHLISAEDSGLGLRDVLYLLYYFLDSSYTVLLIEEPENHIHPDIQRRLLHFMKTIAGKQLFIATHSNVFLDLAYVDKIFYTSIQNEETVVSDKTSKAAMLKGLGFSVADNFVSDLVILTEGPTDGPIIQEICMKLGFFHRFNIRFYPLGGDAMVKVDLSVFAEKNKTVAFIDADPGSGHIRKKFEEKCVAEQIPCFKLNRYSIENYFNLAAIRKVYPNPIPETLQELDPNKKVEEQLRFSVKTLGYKIMQEMTLKDLEGTDLLSYVKNIEEMLTKL